MISSKIQSVKSAYQLQVKVAFSLSLSLSRGIHDPDEFAHKLRDNIVDFRYETTITLFITFIDSIQVRLSSQFELANQCLLIRRIQRLLIN